MPRGERTRPALAPRPQGRRSVDVRVLLQLLPLLVALPLLAYGGFLLYLNARGAGEHARREQAAAHGALQAALEGALDHKLQMLNVLAGSASLGREALDLPRAATIAEGVVGAGLGIEAVAILDRSGAVHVEYPARSGGHGTAPLSPHQLQVFETGRGGVSDLHRSPFDGAWSASIDVPVRRGGQVRWVVSARLDPRHLSSTIAAQVGARDAMSTVLDSHRRIVARTRELERYFGELPSRDTFQALDSGDHGWRRFRTRDGNVYLWTWSTISTGWTVWLGSPAREFDDALRRSMLRLAAVGLGVLLLAMGGTTLLARRIAASVDRMAEDARRLVAGERPPYRPSGIRQLDVLYRALEDANEEVARALAVRDRALAAERAARAVADEHNRSKDLFLGMLSHELRNPLAPIRNSVYILAHADPRSDPAQRAQGVIARQTEHLSRLVDDLLDVTRIARGKIELRRARVDLREVVSRAADDFRGAMEEKGIVLRTSIPVEPVWADADPTRVTQIVGNLLHNASKFTPRGGEVSLSLAAAAGETRLRVRDTGAGIDPAILPTVFDPFVQGERSLARTQGGLGLGLALVKGIAELHGGTVRAESAGQGLGAEFEVRLPIATQAPPEHGRDVRPERSGGDHRAARGDEDRVVAEPAAPRPDETS
jgi:signal transduction histidine kinase